MPFHYRGEGIIYSIIEENILNYKPPPMPSLGELEFAKKMTERAFGLSRTPHPAMAWQYITSSLRGGRRPTWQSVTPPKAVRSYTPHSQNLPLGEGVICDSK